MGASLSIKQSDNPSDNPVRKRALRLKFCEDMANCATLVLQHRTRYAAEAESLSGKKAAEYLASASRTPGGVDPD